MAKQASKLAKAKSVSAEKVSIRPVVAPEPDSSSIAALAYQLWQARGCPEGSPEVDWLQAVRQLSSLSENPTSSSTKRPLLKKQASA